MMKTPRKLVLRRQTLRVLDCIDLSRAVGGVDVGSAQCPALADTGAKACNTGTAPLIATMTCG